MKIRDEIYLILMPTLAMFGPLFIGIGGAPNSASTFLGAFMLGLGVLLLTFKVKDLQKQINALINGKQ